MKESFLRVVVVVVAVVVVVVVVVVTVLWHSGLTSKLKLLAVVSKGEKSVLLTSFLSSSTSITSASMSFGDDSRQPYSGQTRSVTFSNV